MVGTKRGATRCDNMLRPCLAEGEGFFCILTFPLAVNMLDGVAHTLFIYSNTMVIHFYL